MLKIFLISECFQIGRSYYLQLVSVVSTLVHQRKPVSLTPLSFVRNLVFFDMYVAIKAPTKPETADPRIKIRKLSRTLKIVYQCIINES